jgi:hypothetical protein
MAVTRAEEADVHFLGRAGRSTGACWSVFGAPTDFAMRIQEERSSLLFIHGGFDHAHRVRASTPAQDEAVR